MALQRKKNLYGYKKQNFLKSKKSHFSKGVNPFSRETRLTRTQIFGSVTQPRPCLVVSACRKELCG